MENKMRVVCLLLVFLHHSSGFNAWFDKCTDDSNCTRHGQNRVCADSGECLCIIGTQFSDDRRSCLRTANKLEDPCVENSQCKLISKNSVCNGEECICDAGYDIGNLCSKRKVNDSSENCDNDEDCTARNSITFCDTSIRQCKCLEGSKVSTDGKSCIEEVRTIGNVCVEDSQCGFAGASAVCQKGRCFCPSGSHVIEGRCYRTLKIGDLCQSSRQCANNRTIDPWSPASYDNSIAQCDTTCKCGKDYHLAGGFCTSDGNLGLKAIGTLKMLTFFIIFVSTLGA